MARKVKSGRAVTVIGARREFKWPPFINESCHKKKSPLLLSLLLRTSTKKSNSEARW